MCTSLFSKVQNFWASCAGNLFPSVGWLVDLSVSSSVIISWNSENFTLPCSYRSTCLVKNHMWRLLFSFKFAAAKVLISLVCVYGGFRRVCAPPSLPVFLSFFLSLFLSLSIFLSFSLSLFLSLSFSLSPPLFLYLFLYFSFSFLSVYLPFFLFLSFILLLFFSFLSFFRYFTSFFLSSFSFHSVFCVLLLSPSFSPHLI